MMGAFLLVFLMGALSMLCGVVTAFAVAAGWMVHRRRTAGKRAPVPENPWAGIMQSAMWSDPWPKDDTPQS